MLQKYFFVGNAGFDKFLKDELLQNGFTINTNIFQHTENPDLGSLCFPRYGLINPDLISGTTVNQLAGALIDFFGDYIRYKKIEKQFFILFFCPPEIVGLAKRVSAVEKQFRTLLSTRFSRIAKLISTEEPNKPTQIDGFFVYFTDFEKAFCAQKIYFGGQHRTSDDILAPSRSYHKAEEAYSILGMEPQLGETVADLGAAPGGWSYSAAKRGAIVSAVDNGPLKNGALGHKNIIHLKSDAFKFQPAQGNRFDWLFCDMVEQPHHVLRQIEKWLTNRWCWHFVINLKFGRVNPVELLKTLRSADSPFTKNCVSFQIRHLYHDREEITITGTVKR